MKQQLTLEQKTTWVQGLLIDCPFGKALPSCPAHDLRRIPLGKRLGLVKGMNEVQIDQIISHHKACLAEREL
ncbi:MAG: hypothetical protein HN919_23235 [Verrucomicrobia bacterium]|jgi:hypothetical protein|nr:hypothetical protein [Verrucomicrobiota bacterium]